MNGTQHTTYTTCFDNISNDFLMKLFGDAIEPDQEKPFNEESFMRLCDATEKPIAIKFSCNKCSGKNHKWYSVNTSPELVHVRRCFKLKFPPTVNYYKIRANLIAEEGDFSPFLYPVLSTMEFLTNESFPNDISKAEIDNHGIQKEEHHIYLHIYIRRKEGKFNERKLFTLNFEVDFFNRINGEKERTSKIHSFSFRPVRDKNFESTPAGKKQNQLVEEKTIRV